MDLSKKDFQKILKRGTHFPVSKLKYDDFRHIVAFRPNGCIQVDYMGIGEKLAKNYNLRAWYTIGVDVYSRYCCYFINKNAEQLYKGSTSENFKGVIDCFAEKPDMVVADAEFNASQVYSFCEKNKIKLVIVPTGTVGTTSIVDSVILKLKEILVQYLYQFSDIIEERVKEGINDYTHSIKVMNVITYFYNRSFNSGIKGVPIEIYSGLDSPSLPIANYVKYPEFEIGQKVLIRPRGRAKSFTFQQRALVKGIPGKIIDRPLKNTYTVMTTKPKPNNIINVKWYEFVPITDEQYEKIIKMPLFN